MAKSFRFFSVFVLALFASLCQSPSVFAAIERCEIYSDPEGISHARASDRIGAFRCQGYLHGRDRAWQMDYFRRVAQGRLSEILGIGSLKTDFQMRLIGLEEVAKKIYGGLSPESRAILSAYAEGANRGIQETLESSARGSRSGYEFRELGYRPEPWQPEQTIELILLQSFDQTRRSFEERIRESKRLERYGKQAERLFSENGLPWDTSILKPGEYEKNPERMSRVPDRVSSRSSDPLGRALGDWFSSLPSFSIGSNNWAVAASRSRSHHALFANDPHLALRTPSFWYWSQIEGGPINAIGASVPGIPVIVSGASEHLAWGLTNAYLDVSDLFYRDEKEVANATLHRPWIWIRFWKFKLPFFFKSFRRTAEGWPILPLDSPPGKAIVLRWSGYDLKPEYFESFIGMLGARTLDEVDSILAHTKIPSWNFVFADDRGQIGFRATGNPPSRRRDMPYGILPESSEWRTLTAEEMPHVLRPARGFVATANNRHWPEDARSWEGRIYEMGFRAQRIEELIRVKPLHDLNSMRAIQCDTQAVDAKYFLPLLLKHLTGSELRDSRAPAALSALKAWDFSTGLDCAACGVYRFWIEGLFSKYGVDERALYRLLGGKSAPPDFDAGITAAFVAALGELKPWGEIHETRFRHLAGVDRFQAPLIPIPGDQRSIDVSSSVWWPKEKIFYGDSGPSERIVVELSSPPKIVMDLPGLARDRFPLETPDPSGPWMRWSRCETHPVEFPLDWSRLHPNQVSRIQF